MGQSLIETPALFDMDRLLYKDSWEGLLLEATNQELRTKVKTEEPKVVQRAKPLVSHYQGMRRGTQFWFKTTSATTPGVDWWYQVISLKLPQDLKKPVWASILKALRGDIKVKCTCPAFKFWGYWYITGGMDALFGHKTTKFPRINNPRLKGAVCKHVYNVLTVLSANMPEITRDVKRKRRL